MFFLSMHDFTKIEDYEHSGLNGESNLPNNFFLGICGYLKKLFKKLKDRAFKLANKHSAFFLNIPKHFQMQNFNNIFWSLCRLIILVFLIDWLMINLLAKKFQTSSAFTNKQL